MSPRISFAADRSFTYTIEYEEIVGPGPGNLDLFCVSIDVVPLAPTRVPNGRPIFQRYRCQFGLIVVGGSGD